MCVCVFALLILLPAVHLFGALQFQVVIALSDESAGVTQEEVDTGPFSFCCISILPQLSPYTRKYGRIQRHVASNGRNRRSAPSFRTSSIPNEVSLAIYVCPNLFAYPLVRMKLLGGFLALGVVPIVDLTCAQVVGGSGRPSAVRAGMTRFAEEAVSDVGVAQVHAIAHEDEEVGESLVEKLQADGQATGEMSSPLVRVKLAPSAVRRPLYLIAVQSGIKSIQKYLTRRHLPQTCATASSQR